MAVTQVIGSSPQPVMPHRCQPPKNRITIKNAAVTMCRNSAIKIQQQLHAGIFGVIAADQFLLGLGQVERQPGRFGERGDHEDHETQRLSETFQMPRVGLLGR